MIRFSDSVDEFHEAAREACGLDDFGEDDYLEALHVLCASLDEDARLSPVGVEATRGMIIDSLRARLLAEEGWKCFPDSAETRIERPLVIIGLPRSGTTALHHLLSQAPGLQGLEHWLLRNPKPRPPRDRWRQDPDFLACQARLEAIYERSPEMRAIHEIEADLPDECWLLLSQTFTHCSWEANANVTGYARWWADCDMRPAYRRHRRNAQLIGHLEPESRWLLKDANHLFNLESMLEVYPDALVVQTHRDPVKVIASVCSLCWSSRLPLNEGMDPRAFGRATVDLWERSITRMMSARSRCPDARFHDLGFERFVEDPLAAIREIHEAFDLPYDEASEAAIRAFRAAHPPGRHGRHAYSLEQWGLEAEEIRERFRPYLEAYDVSSGHEQPGGKRRGLPR
ncbi:MAG: sulfotransferase [Deltaproteobacteria bacterium]|nr:sulfotransferase [Deltaproteobacteria bacterium]